MNKFQKMIKQKKKNKLKIQKKTKKNIKKKELITVQAYLK